MSDNFQQVIEYLNERTPQARLERHKAFWGDNPAPEVAALIQAVERMLIDGKAELKALHLLKDLDHRQTLRMWDHDPDTVAGEKTRRERKGGGDTTAEKRKQERKDRVTEAVKLWDDMENARRSGAPKHNRAAIIAKKMNLSDATVRGYLHEAGRMHQRKTNRR